MATETTNLHLTKPDGTDLVLVGDMNSNMDVVDSAVGKLSDLTTSVKTNLVSAINEANESGANAPYIGDNGNWYEWDVATTQYVDTGVSAHGDTGTAAGFGTPNASASGLASGESPTVSVTASGDNASKIFDFSFGIPKGDKGDTGESAGFGIPTASATVLGAGVNPTVQVTATGQETGKIFDFQFGIPKGDAGTGNNWYTGSSITGTSTVPSTYATGIAFALVGDMYLNNGEIPETGRVYQCTTAGDASTALWKYVALLRGADGEGSGDMLKSTYDTDDDGIVDNAERLGGQLPSYYADVASIPTATSDLTNDSGYITSSALPSGASSTESGIAKLYNETGSNADGAITQAAATTAISEKQNTVTVTGILKGGGSGSISAAVAGTDYATPSTVIYATIGTSWSGSSAPYSQAITANGVLTTDTPIVDLVTSSTYSTAELEIAAYSKIYKMSVTSANTITVYAKEATTQEITVQIKVVR